MAKIADWGFKPDEYAEYDEVLDDNSQNSAVAPVQEVEEQVGKGTDSEDRVVEVKGTRQAW
jgi:hypothetical protein